MARVIVGVFPNSGVAEQAVVELKGAGFDPQRIGFLMRTTDEARQAANAVSGDAVGADVSTGAVTGGILGGALGAILAATGTFVIPGIGPFVSAGILATAFAGGAAGAIVGGLVGLGIPHEEAEYYHQRVQEGAVLVTVDAAGRESEARQILLRHGAEDTWSTAPWQRVGEPPTTQMGLSAQRLPTDSAESKTPETKPLHRTAPIIDRASRESDTGQQANEASARRSQAPSGGEAGALGAERTSGEPGGVADRGSVVGPGDAIQHGPVTDPFAGKLQVNGPAEGHINYDDPALGQRTSPAAPNELPPERPKP